MAEGAALNEYGEVPQHIRDKIKAHAAACDNIAVFFGEDIFIAFGAVLLIDAFLKENGIQGIEPLHIGLWAIPTAIAVNPWRTASSAAASSLSPCWRDLA